MTRFVTLAAAAVAVSGILVALPAAGQVVPSGPQLYQRQQDTTQRLMQDQLQRRHQQLRQRQFDEQRRRTQELLRRQSQPQTLYADPYKPRSR